MKQNYLTDPPMSALRGVAVPQPGAPKIVSASEELIESLGRVIDRLDGALGNLSRTTERLGGANPVASEAPTNARDPGDCVIASLQRKVSDLSCLADRAELIANKMNELV